MMNTNNKPFEVEWYFLGEQSGALTTRKESHYGLPLLPGHEMFAIEVIVVGHNDPAKGYRIGNFGLN